MGDEMTAQEYLEQIEKYDRIIESRKLEIMDLRSRASLPASFSSETKVQTSRRADGMENLIINYIEKEEELQEVILECWEKRQDIIRTIEQLKAKEYGLLYCVFVERVNLQEAAARFDRTYSWATTIKAKALKNLQKILDERKRNGLQNN